ncbi:hypothetical protein ACFOET_11145 [Parapedobacter deserti]|uniref:Uncharacterized protein n=1 Tax=Parapedobacter deserti TaxID=1912957 RepID=A0ABV7JLU6_9SPHI
MGNIYWRILFNTTKRETARRLIGNLVKHIGECEILNLQPYWKDKNLFEAEFRQELSFQTSDRSLVEFLKKVSSVSDIWEVNFANAFNEVNQDVSVVANSAFKIQGIYWATVSLDRSND